MTAENVVAREVVLGGPSGSVRRGARWLKWFLVRKPLAAIGAVLVLLVLICGVFAPLVAPYGYADGQLADSL